MYLMLPYSLFNLQSKDSCNVSMSWGCILEVAIDYFESVYIKHQTRNQLISNKQIILNLQITFYKHNTNTPHQNFWIANEKTQK